MRRLHTAVSRQFGWQYRTPSSLCGETASTGISSVVIGEVTASPPPVSSTREPSAAVLRLRQKADAIRQAKVVCTNQSSSETRGKGHSSREGDHGAKGNSSSKGKSKESGDQRQSRGAHTSSNSHRTEGASAGRAQTSSSSAGNAVYDEFWGEDHRRSFSTIEHIFGKPKYDLDGKIIPDLDPAHLQDKMGDFHLNHLL